MFSKLFGNPQTEDFRLLGFEKKKKSGESLPSTYQVLMKGTYFHSVSLNCAF